MVQEAAWDACVCRILEPGLHPSSNASRAWETYAQVIKAQTLKPLTLAWETQQSFRLLASAGSCSLTALPMLATAAQKLWQCPVTNKLMREM